MADLDSHFSDNVHAKSDPAAVNAEAPCASANGNHVPPRAASEPGPSPQTTNNARDDRSGLDRAEEIVDSLAEKLSSLTSNWGRKFLRVSSRARESVQDFWAEVQDLRRGRKP
jgi:hypothetical protein